MGYRKGSELWIGKLEGTTHVAPLMELETFYARMPGTADKAPASTQDCFSIADVFEVPPVPARARILCVGLNYRAHAAEGGFSVPQYPTIFGRWTASLTSSGCPVPVIDPQTDWEGELAVIVGSTLANVDEATALRSVFGYAAFNDISARTYQRHTPQWTLGKNADRSGVIGSIVTADEVGDPAQGLRLETRVNRQLMQSASTADMIFSVGRILSYLSEILTLNPGDVIATGTPSGVGHARKPPRFLVPGDIVEVEIERVGSLRTPMTDSSMR
jgi:2,4-didehydro-3-deoxy-L-rhamnonate hydrolase